MIDIDIAYLSMGVFGYCALVYMEWYQERLYMIFQWDSIVGSLLFCVEVILLWPCIPYLSYKYRNYTTSVNADDFVDIETEDQEIMQLYANTFKE
jgi:hypothetical protein